MSMKMVVLSQQEIRNGVRHDEFREMELPDMGQFMAMDEKPVLIDVRDSLGDISRRMRDSGMCRGTGWGMGLRGRDRVVHERGMSSGADVVVLLEKGHKNKGEWNKRRER